MMTDAGVAELLPAIEQGVLKVDTLGLEEGGDTDVLVQRVSDLIAKVVAPGSTTLPMFDDTSGGFLRAMQAEGTLSSARLEGAQQVGMASQFIEWVPAFPNASIDRILAARSDMQASLTRYRAAVIRLTRELETSPVDDAFGNEVRDRHRQYVQPELTVIDELSHELGLWATVSSTMSSSSGRLATAGVAIAVAGAAAIPELLYISIPVVAVAVSKIFEDRRQRKAEQRANQFFYLYEADRKLEEG
jgi:hypothetical protein